jgi:hypothetical protein
MKLKIPSNELRPSFNTKMPANDFDNWYWSKEDLTSFCEQLGLTASGSKEHLRLRVLSSLPGGNPIAAKKTRRASSNCFDWANAVLTGDTILTSDVTFGRNFRAFMKSQIGTKFQCHGDFMAWVKDNPGRTLNEAVETWQQLEARKKIPGFRRDIAVCNNYLRYLRDFQDRNPDRSYDDAKACWHYKKLRPASAGYVVYATGDLELALSTANQPSQALSKSSQA